MAVNWGLGGCTTTQWYIMPFVTLYMYIHGLLYKLTLHQPGSHLPSPSPSCKNPGRASDIVWIETTYWPPAQAALPPGTTQNNTKFFIGRDLCRDSRVRGIQVDWCGDDTEPCGNFKYLQSPSLQRNRNQGQHARYGRWLVKINISMRTCQDSCLFNRSPRSLRSKARRLNLSYTSSILLYRATSSAKNTWCLRAIVSLKTDIRRSCFWASFH